MTSKSSGAHTDSSNANTTIDVEYNEARSCPMGQKAVKRKYKKRVTQIDEISQVMQHSVAHLEEHNNNKKVDQLIQAHKLLAMDT